ncbi:MAG: ACP S-malonyltransferase [Myxococcales bacterium]|nr:ACP S-malonyltransferase [Myxococcales bacterium]
MSRVAFVYPGQGSQKVGMGREVFEQSKQAREVFQTADDVLGFSLRTMCFEGPEEALKLTANTQPAILTTSLALHRAFGETPDVVAGHSLGEWTANVVAGSIGMSDAIRLVRLRGTYMQEAVPVGTGAMAAVLKAERELVDRVCRETPGVVEPVNYNCPGQIVIAGEAKAVEAASERLKAEKARVMPLPVSAPFHCSLMEPAERRLALDLAKVEMRDARFPLYTNIGAAPVTRGEELKSALLRQVSRAVRWEEAVTQMVEDGVRLFVEIGPGRVLTGLISRITSEAKVVSVQTPDDFAAARDAIAEARNG